MNASNYYSLKMLLIFFCGFFTVPITSLAQSGSTGALPLKSVDLASGNVVLSQPLSSVKGFQLSLKYNSEGVEKIASSWNQKLGTRTTGLGWSLGENRIVRLTNQTGTLTDDRYMLHFMGKVFPLTLTRIDSVGVVPVSRQYRSADSPTLLVHHILADDNWEVRKKDGTLYVFGETTKSPGSKSTEYSVTWGNWIGPSVQPTNEKISVAWNLSAIENIVGQVVQLKYQQDEENVGTNTVLHTRASYLKEVTGFYGHRLELTYQPKNANEYVDPHQEYSFSSSNDKDAYQERYFDKYLEKVSLYDENDNKLGDHELIYTMLNSGSANFQKRMLTEVRSHNSNAYQTTPPIVYDYYGLTSGDGLSVGFTSVATTLYNDSNGALYGAIKSKTSTLGATTLYEYGKESIGGSELTIELSFPPDHTFIVDQISSSHQFTTGWEAPKLFFGHDYVVAIYNSISKVKRFTRIQVYNWSGDRWVKEDIKLHDNSYVMSGTFFDDYKSWDEYDRDEMAAFRRKVGEAIINIPGLSDFGQAFEDLGQDVVTDFYNVYKDFKDSSDHPEKAIEDFFTGIAKSVADVDADIEAGLEDIVLDFVSIVGDANTKYTIAEKKADKQEIDHRGTYPRREYHIALEKDFFALVTSWDGGSIRLFEKNSLNPDKWDRYTYTESKLHSKFFELASGDHFITVLDNMSDVGYIFSQEDLTWSFKGYRLPMVKDGDLFSSSQQGMLSTSQTNTMIETTSLLPGSVDVNLFKDLHEDQRTSMDARNNVIVATTIGPDGQYGRVSLLYHDEDMNFHVSAQGMRNKRKFTHSSVVSNSLQTQLDRTFGDAARVKIAIGNSFAAIQMYDHIENAALTGLEAIGDPLGIGSSLVNNFVSDPGQVNSTFAVRWDKDMAVSHFEHLGTHWGQTGASMMVVGNNINIISKAYTLLDNNSGDDGKNFSYRFDGKSFVPRTFDSQFFTTAVAPDIMSAVIKDPNDSNKKNPQFYQFDPNTAIVSTAVSEEDFLKNIFLNNLTENVSYSSDSWSEITPASGESVPSPTFAKQVTHVTVEILNDIIMIAGMAIGIGEAAAVVEATEALSTVNEVLNVAGNLMMFVEPGADALIDKIIGVNHKSTSIANNFISVNGKIFRRQPNGTWQQQTGHVFGTDLLGTDNGISSNHILYSNNPSNVLTSHIKTFKNGTIYNTIRIDTTINSHHLVAYRDMHDQVDSYDAFVAYGPAGSDGKVTPNSARESYRDPLQRNKDILKKIGLGNPDDGYGYNEAQTILLYKVVGNEVKGSLHDYVVRKVTINDGYASTFNQLDYDGLSAEYKSSTGDGIYGKVAVTPQNDAANNGKEEYYFFNKNNYVTIENQQESGYPASLTFPTSDSLVTYRTVFAKDSAAFKSYPRTLTGRKYYSRVLDGANNVVSEKLNCLRIWRSDFYHFNADTSLQAMPVYQVRSYKKIDVLDDVTHETSMYYEQYPILRLKYTEKSSRNAFGESEILGEEKVYAYEKVAELRHQHRFNELATVQKYVKTGNVRQNTSAVSNEYTPYTINGNTVYLPHKVYEAVLSDDLGDPLSLSYVAKAAANEVERNVAIGAYEAKLAEQEALKGNAEAFMAALEGSYTSLENVFSDYESLATDVTTAYENYRDYLNNNTIIADQQAFNNLTTQITNAKNRIKDLHSEISTDSTKIADLHDEIAKLKWERHLGWLGGPIVGLIVEEAVNKKIDKKEDQITALQEAMGTKNDEITTKHNDITNFNNQKTDLTNQINAIKTAIKNANATHADAKKSFDKIKLSKTQIPKFNRSHYFGELEDKHHTHTKHKKLHGVSLMEVQTFHARLGNLSNKIDQLFIAAGSQGGHLTYSTNAYININICKDRSAAVATHLGECGAYHEAIASGLLTYFEALGSEQLSAYNRKWLEKEQVLQRDDKTGKKLAWRDAKGNEHSVVYEQQNREHVVADFVNTNIYDNYSFFYDFEHENIPASLSIVGASAVVDGTDAHTGARSLSVTAPAGSPKTVKLNDFQRKLTDSIYVFSAWVKHKDVGSKVQLHGFTSVPNLGSNGNAHTSDEFITKHWEGDTEYSSSIGSSSDEDWKYVEYLVTLHNNDKPEIVVSDGQVLLDNVLIRPVNTIAKTYSYNNRGQVITSVSNDGLLTKHLYDGFHRHLTSVDDVKRSSGLKLHGFSRGLGGSGTFDASNPNSTTTIKFQGELNNLVQTQSSPEGNWVSPSYLLDAESTDRDFVYHFSIPTTITDGQTFEFKYASFHYVLHYDKFVISGTGNGTTVLGSNYEETSQGDWAILRYGTNIYVFKDGALVSSLDNQTITFGPGQTEKSLEVKSNLANAVASLIGYAPIVNQTYSDGLGRSKQTQRFELVDGSDDLAGVVVREVLYDGWGNPAVKTLPAFNDSKSLSYRAGFVTSYDWSTDEIDGEVKTYFMSARASNEINGLTADDAKYASSRVEYEAHPLARKTAVIMPGKQLHDHNSNQTEIAYQDADADAFMSEMGIVSGQEDDFIGMTTTQPGPSKTSLIRDKRNRVVGKKNGNAIEKIVYDDKDQYTSYQKFMPNSFQASGSFHNGLPSGTELYTDDPQQGTVGDFSNMYIDIPLVDSKEDAETHLPTDSFTVSSWVKLNSSAGAWGGIIGYFQDNGSSEFGWILGLRDNKLCIATATENSSGLAYLRADNVTTLNTWYHVAGVYDGQNLKLYVNGQLEKTYAMTGSISYPVSGTYSIGRYKDNDEDYRLNGSLNDVMVNDRAFSAAEISQLYSNSDAYSDDSGTLAFYAFDGNASNSASSSVIPNTVNNAVSGVYDAQDQVGVQYTYDSGRGTVAKYGTQNGLDFEGYATVPGITTKSEAETYLPTGSFTASFWVKITGSLVNWGNIFGFQSDVPEIQEKGWTLGLNNGKWSFGVRATSNTGSYVDEVVATDGYQKGVWYHVTGVYNGQTMKLYVDGVEEASLNVTGTVQYPDAGKLSIGYDNGGVGAVGVMRGTYVDDVVLFDRALFPSEVTELYNGQHSNATDLLAFYPMDGTSLNHKDTYSGPNHVIESVNADLLGYDKSRKSPDEGDMQLIRNQYGQPSFSRHNLKRVKYSKYDGLGREVESGLLEKEFVAVKNEWVIDFEDHTVNRKIGDVKGWKTGGTYGHLAKVQHKTIDGKVKKVLTANPPSHGGANVEVQHFQGVPENLPELDSFYVDFHNLDPNYWGIHLRIGYDRNNNFSMEPSERGVGISILTYGSNNLTITGADGQQKASKSYSFTGVKAYRLFVDNIKKKLSLLVDKGSGFVPEPGMTNLPLGNYPSVLSALSHYGLYLFAADPFSLDDVKFTTFKSKLANNTNEYLKLLSDAPFWDSEHALERRNVLYDEFKAPLGTVVATIDFEDKAVDEKVNAMHDWVAGGTHPQNLKVTEHTVDGKVKKKMFGYGVPDAGNHIIAHHFESVPKFYASDSIDIDIIGMPVQYWGVSFRLGDDTNNNSKLENSESAVSFYVNWYTDRASFSVGNQLISNLNNQSIRNSSEFRIRINRVKGTVSMYVDRGTGNGYEVLPGKENIPMDTEAFAKMKRPGIKIQTQGDMDVDDIKFTVYRSSLEKIFKQIEPSGKTALYQLGKKTYCRYEDDNGQIVENYYAYDRKGHKVIDLSIRDEKHYLTKYEYDLLGRVTGITYPNNKKVSYEYDKLGRLKNISSMETADIEYRYNTANKVKEVRRDQGNMIETKKYEIYGLLSDTELKVGNTLKYKQSLGYIDANQFQNGNIVSYSVTGPDVNSQNAFTYLYDDRFQLTRVDRNSGGVASQFNYSYDLNGNMIHQSYSGTNLNKSYTYQYGKNMRSGYVSNEEGQIIRLER